MRAGDETVGVPVNYSLALQDHVSVTRAQAPEKCTSQFARSSREENLPFLCWAPPVLGHNPAPQSRGLAGPGVAASSFLRGAQPPHLETSL